MYTTDQIKLGPILEKVNEGVLLVDLSGYILAINPALARLLRVTRRPVQGVLFQKPLFDSDASLMTLAGYTQSTWDEACKALSSRKLNQIQENLVLNGEHLERTHTAINDTDGNLSGWLLVYRDTSEEMELSRLREEMIQMLIHDLRSPLATLFSSLSMLRSMLAEKCASDVQELINLSQQGTERMLELVNELLEIIQLENELIPLSQEPINIGDLLESSVSRILPFAQEAKIEVRVMVEPGLPILKGDSQKLGRVINNLLDNAIKFTQDGGEVRLWAHLDSENPRAYMMIGVSDNGQGIPEDSRKRIFGKFQRVTTTRGRRLGTGLGLAFCKLAVEEHHGEIWVESQEGEGSTFFIRLPLQDYPLQTKIGGED